MSPWMPKYGLHLFIVIARKAHMRRISIAALLVALAIMPLRSADWLTHSGDPQRTGWQQDETKISKESVKNLKLLWTIKLETKQRSVYSLYGPLIIERAITDRGFKELAFVAGAGNDLFAVDADQVSAAEWQAVQPRARQQHHLHDHRTRLRREPKQRLLTRPHRSGEDGAVLAVGQRRFVGNRRSGNWNRRHGLR